MTPLGRSPSFHHFLCPPFLFTRRGTLTLNYLAFHRYLRRKQSENMRRYTTYILLSALALSQFASALDAFPGNRKLLQGTGGGSTSGGGDTAGGGTSSGGNMQEGGTTTTGTTMTGTQGTTVATTG